MQHFHSIIFQDLPLRGLEGVPGRPGAPQDEAGLIPFDTAQGGRQVAGPP